MKTANKKLTSWSYVTIYHMWVFKWTFATEQFTLDMTLTKVVSFWTLSKEVCPLPRDGGNWSYSSVTRSLQDTLITGLCSSLESPAGSRACCSSHHRCFFLKCVLLMIPSAACISSFTNPHFCEFFDSNPWSPESHTHTFLGTSLSKDIFYSFSAIEWQSCYCHFKWVLVASFLFFLVSRWAEKILAKPLFLILFIWVFFFSVFLNYLGKYKIFIS